MTDQKGTPTFDRRLTTIDAMILAYLVQRPIDITPPENEVQLRNRTRWLRHKLHDQETPVVLTAVTVSEFLRPIHPDDRQLVMQKLSNRFRILPFDLPASYCAAELFSETRANKKSFFREVYGDQSTRIKADIMIVATARAHGVKVLYSHDSKVRKLTKLAGLVAMDLPTRKNLLFDSEE